VGGVPDGVPPLTQVRSTFSSRALSASALRKRPGALSTCHGGMCPPSSSALIDSPHGTASACVSSDMGAMPPGRWHSAQRARTIGSTSSVKV
jgi:hypothetical protein